MHISVCCISITIVQSYTGKYHEFVAVCIVTSAQRYIFSGYYSEMILSYGPSVSLYVLGHRLVPDMVLPWLGVKIWLFINCVQLQGFPIHLHELDVQ